jgi:uncharacterized protein (TIGR00255 family)
LIRSMTGFGEASSTVGGAHYFLEIRTLNARYFKAIIRLPDHLQGLEAELDAELRHRLARGSITLTASCTDASDQAAYAINQQAIENYLTQASRSPALARLVERSDLGTLLSLPGVLQPPVFAEDRIEKARAAFMPLLEKACQSLTAMREREGAMLLKDLMEQRDLIADRLAIVIERAPLVVDEYARRLHTRVQQMLQDAGVTLQPSDLIREIAVFAERSDIAEEIKRLTGHIEQYTDLLTKNGGKPVGRTLDFLTQEMLREANTMASKSSDSTLSRAIVEIKGAIDRIKEQVQNVE